MDFPDFKAECVMVNKVYFSCQQRECFEDVFVPLPDSGKYEFIDITFNQGKIIKNTLDITPIPNRPNFSRVRFRIRITFTLRVREICDEKNILAIRGELPEIQKDIIMFMPEARSEFKFKIILETASQILTEPVQEERFFTFAAGTFLIVKAVGRVQLLVPAYGFCPEPADCEEFLPDDVCIDFDDAPFPNFFPPQLEDLEN
ncbi:hypothetical protein [Alkaliphilus transvaalensis]|uniref:hypothetical protein n=1 Tax=Alkaliphilus transvaalensis TaxID=114628 RepID=UPI001FA781E6|nr:hypothetical protein [Alkaliphilus transvaalensis]